MLDESQLAFTMAGNDRIRLLAPAGSGKTNSLLQRCARIGLEAPNERFLFITFTRAAKNELNARLQRDPALRHVSANVRVPPSRLAAPSARARLSQVSPPPNDEAAASLDCAR